VSNSTVRGILPGTCTIQGSQAGNTSYNSATGNSSVTVIKANQTISLNAPDMYDHLSTGMSSSFLLLILQRMGSRTDGFSTVDTLIYADWVPHDNVSSGSCLALESRVNLFPVAS
jgi:cell division inhibitor SulA